MSETNDPHALHSVLRERILEHLFVGEILRTLWRRSIWDVEVLRAEFDAGGYDLMISCGEVARYVQLKAMRSGGKKRSIGTSLKLAKRTGGCVVWMVVTEDLTIEHFLWFGGAADELLPDISDLKVLRHVKANALGAKAERAGHRTIPRSRFETIMNLDGLVDRLFGSAAQPA